MRRTTARTVRDGSPQALSFEQLPAAILQM
jgi:hypothetical protein